jgi:hypothetical protein
MLRYVNHADRQLFSLSLGVLQNWLCLSGEMEQVFQAIGGFQLTDGFFQRIDVVYFHPNICSVLFALFASLSSCAPRSQMLEFIWLNFDLWSKMSFAFQVRMYSGGLMHIYHKGEFELQSFELLCQVQLPFLQGMNPQTMNIPSYNRSDQNPKVMNASPF